MQKISTNQPNSAGVALEYARRIWDNRDLSAIEELTDKEVVIHSSLGKFSGQGKLKEVVSAYWTAFPDLNVINDFIIREKDKTMVHWKAAGCHSGVFKGVAPTGRKVSYEGVTIYQVESGLIKEYWAYLDLHHLLQQLKG